jgi:hypothetical protein
VIFVFEALVTLAAPTLLRRLKFMKGIMEESTEESRDSLTPSLEQVASTARGDALRYAADEKRVRSY